MRGTLSSILPFLRNNSDLDSGILLWLVTLDQSVLFKKPEFTGFT